MSSESDWTETQTERGLIKLTGIPAQTLDLSERRTWRRFLSFLWPWTKTRACWATSYGGGLAKEFVEAEVAKRQGEAAKLAAEVADLTAQRDSTVQETVTAVNDEIARIFSQQAVPEIAKKLQLANLLSAHPDLVTQLDRIEELYSRMNSLHGFKMEFEQPEGEETIVMDANLES